MVVDIDGRRLGRLAKPTPQRPWREASFLVDGEAIVVGLTWHVPVMRTDVFVGGRSARDGRPLDAVRADAPTALSNYEVWFGGLFATPFFGSRPRPPRAWPVMLVASLLIWWLAFVLSPPPPGVRLVGGVALLVSGVVLGVAAVWSMLAFGERLHRELLDRPSLGDRRVALWFAGVVGYTLLGVVAVILFVALAAS